MLLNTWALVNTWEIPAVVTEVEEQPSGGYEFWDSFAKELERRREEKRRRLEELEESKRIAAKLDRQLALEERKLEAEAARKAELARFNRLIAQNQDVILSMDSERLEFVMKDALERQTFSAIERLERELMKVRDEEQFLLMATQILVNQ